MKVYTTREAATALGVSMRRVQQACKHYGLGRWFGRQLVLTDSDIAVIRDRLGRVGRPAQSHNE